MGILSQKGARQVVDVKRIVAFALIIVVSLGIMIWSTPGILDNVRLGLDLKGGFEVLYVAKPVDETQELNKEILQEAARSLFMRADAIGVSEPEVFPEGENRIRVRLAGVSNQDEVKEILKKPAELTFRSADGCESPTDYCKIELRGNDFVEGAAKVEFNPETNMPYVSIEVKDAKKFEEITTRLLYKRLAIFLDDQLISEPVVRVPVRDGTASITGSRTYQEAEELAGIINLGALPVTLEEVYTQSVGATLGLESLEKTVKAGIIALVLILIYMVIFYRVPGLIASVTLLMYCWLTLLILNAMNATLTLPGIAAFVLGVGMAVDANIITSERIKEEIRSGKTILSSFRAGNRHSLRSIMDANITTILAALVLYYLGTGAIQGFALILIMSILASILTNVLISRFLLYLLIRSKVVDKPGCFAVKEAEISEL